MITGPGAEITAHSRRPADTITRMTHQFILPAALLAAALAASADPPTGPLPRLKPTEPADAAKTSACRTGS